MSLPTAKDLRHPNTAFVHLLPGKSVRVQGVSYTGSTDEKKPSHLVVSYKDAAQMEKDGVGKIIAHNHAPASP